MILSDGDLVTALSSGRLVVDPLAPGAVQPASVDVRLGPGFLVVDRERAGEVVDLADAPEGLMRAVPGDELVLRPGEFALGTTLERIEVGADLAVRLEGRSSIGRLGLLVHATAGFVDPGFRGTVTLELASVLGAPVRLRAGMPIGQLCCHELTSPVVLPYGAAGRGSHYQGQDGARASRLCRPAPAGQSS